MIPLISSICHGPLGVCQLPRFWWKALLRQAGLLDPEYPDCSSGLDKWVLMTLELDQEQTLEYLRGETPTYLDFEAWVLEQKGGEMDWAAVDRWNEAVWQRVHADPAKIAETYGDIGLSSDVTCTSAVLLNSLQDWQLFYRRDLMADSSDLRAPVVPLISSIDQGPLEVCQLPRTWLKVVLKTRGLLHPDYPDCGGGLDARVLEVLGLDQEQTLGFLREELPDYLEFEEWVLDQCQGELDQEATESWNRSIYERVHTDGIRTRILATVGWEDDEDLTSALVLNHIEDWHLAHGDLLSSA